MPGIVASQWTGCASKDLGFISLRVAPLEDSCPFYTHNLHHLELHAGNNFRDRIVRHVDALPFQGLVAFLALVLERHFITLNHDRIEYPLPTLTLNMRSYLQHIRMGEFLMLLG